MYVHVCIYTCECIPVHTRGGQRTTLRIQFFLPRTLGFEHTQVVSLVHQLTGPGLYHCVGQELPLLNYDNKSDIICTEKRVKEIGA